MNAVVEITTAAGRREVHLGQYLAPGDEERALTETYTWIKGLRHARVNGVPLRRRFLLRDDSLWWFAELYLHKQQIVLQVLRTIGALEHLVVRESPAGIRLVDGGRVAQHVVDAFARARGLAVETPLPTRATRFRAARMDLRARALRLAALGSRLRPRTAPRLGRVDVAAFVHRAFWRESGPAGGAESYIGPVLDVVARRLPVGGLRLVGIGPPANFRARRWWHALRRAPQAVEPIEAFAPLDRLRDSAAAWRDRHANRRALLDSPDVRDHAVIRGCDCWPVLREELAGIALLQWPWSVRAMDEAAAAIDCLEPSVVLTYAEAGGWGRALVLEARRRGVPSVGVQHGFIYRHWLNYLHEPDEMTPDPGHPQERGFPHPDATLLFDAYAATHLEEAGHFPASALAVTGSPRLDVLVDEVRRLTPADVEAARQAAGARAGQHLVLIVTKEKEARGVLPWLLRAVEGRSDVFVAIKTHPAETPEVYGTMAAGCANVNVLPAATPLAPLLGACRAVVTVNSTVALDAAVLGVPALVIGLPNNLSPFVEGGVMAGVPHGEDVGRSLTRILYDDEFRSRLDRDRRAFLERFRIGADGRAAERAAEAVLARVAAPGRLRAGATGESGT